MIRLEKAKEIVTYYETPFAKGKNKGKTPLDTAEFGFTSYVNAKKVVRWFDQIGGLS